MLLIGIDIGTSSCKVAAFYTDGTPCATVTKNYKVYYKEKGWAEQDPNEWYGALCLASRELMDKIQGHNILAVGVDGQSWSAIPIDKNGEVLHNTPIWMDTRAVDECKKLSESIGYDRIFEVCKNPIKPCYSTPKILWFKNNMPSVYRKTYKFLQSNSYINYKLTGVLSQDTSQGYGHLFYDMEKGVYNESLAQEMGVDIAKLPKIYACDSVIGEITASASLETGLPKGTPVVAGGLDAATAALGVGVYTNGKTQEQGGQAGGMSICLDRALSHRSLILSNHVVKGCWLLQGGTVGGGGAIKWFSEQFGGAFGGDRTLGAIDKEAESIPAGSEGVIFLPYMAGERSPIWDEKAKGVFFGLGYDKRRAHLARAVMEGVAFSLRHNLDTAEEAGAFVDELLASGGSANSSVWMQIKADVTGKVIKVPNSDNASALGAAILGGVGVGAYKNYREAVEATVSLQRTYIPDRSCAEVYERGYHKYLEIYEKLKHLM